METKIDLSKLSDYDLIIYCSEMHPDDDIREKAELLRFALHGDISRVASILRSLLDNKIKIVAYYPAIDSKDVIAGLSYLCGITDGALYAG